MKLIGTELEGVFIIEPDVYADDRGTFSVTFTAKDFSNGVGGVDFVQDNQSVSKYGVVRGLHFQSPPFAQAKLVRAVTGRILDVAVDIRKDSPTFGRHITVELSDENNRQLFIPRGFAHGFSVLSKQAVVQYKCDAYYAPSHEGGIAFDDPGLGIDWGIPARDIILSEKDLSNPTLEHITLHEQTANE